VQKRWTIFVDFSNKFVVVWDRILPVVVEKFDVKTHGAIHVSSRVEDSYVEARRAYHYGAGRGMMDFARLP